ncbi:30S ribosomal protein S18 [Spirochaetota bacterium]
MMEEKNNDEVKEIKEEDNIKEPEVKEEVKAEEIKAEEPVKESETKTAEPVKEPEVKAVGSTGAVERKPAPADSRGRPDRGRRPDDSGRRGSYQRGGMDNRMPRFKKKVCRFCYEKGLEVDYKNSDILERFITDRGKILPRRVTGACAKHQRAVARAIKRARIIALVPFVEQ